MATNHNGERGGEPIAASVGIESIAPAMVEVERSTEKAYRSSTRGAQVTADNPDGDTLTAGVVRHDGGVFVQQGKEAETAGDHLERDVGVCLSVTVCEDLVLSEPISTMIIITRPSSPATGTRRTSEPHSPTCQLQPPLPTARKGLRHELGQFSTTKRSVASSMMTPASTAPIFHHPREFHSQAGGGTLVGGGRAARTA